MEDDEIGSIPTISVDAQRAAESLRRDERALTAPVLADLRKIVAMFAAGYPAPDVQQRLGLTDREWKHRLHLFKRRSRDAALVWERFQAKAEFRYGQLDTLRANAMAAGDFAAARAAIADMMKLDRQIIEVGQLLGTYRQVPKKVEISTPSLGMFHDTPALVSKDSDPEVVD